MSSMPTQFILTMCVLAHLIARASSARLDLLDLLEANTSANGALSTGTRDPFSHLRPCAGSYTNSQLGELEKYGGTCTNCNERFREVIGDIIEVLKKLERPSAMQDMYLREYHHCGGDFENFKCCCVTESGQCSDEGQVHILSREIPEFGIENSLWACNSCPSLPTYLSECDKKTCKKWFLIRKQQREDEVRILENHLKSKVSGQIDTFRWSPSDDEYVPDKKWYVPITDGSMNILQDIAKICSGDNVIKATAMKYERLCTSCDPKSSSLNTCDLL